MRAPSSLLLPLCALACVSEHGPLTNRMAQSATSYLARAARQPVGWQPWGRDAFALAARLDRPVLLYVGADDCRWCGVMDREVYGDQLLGTLIDSLFVPIRVDRDERPDLADRYAAAVRLLAGLRGYPITVFLTPDGSAFFGGTYFPLDDPVTGRGLKQLLPEVAKRYREARASVLERAALVRRALGRGPGARGALTPAVVEAGFASVRAALELAARTHAATDDFLHAQAVGLLLARYTRTGDSSDLAPARAVLDELVDSGAAALGEGARDDPPGLVRAAVLRDLVTAWTETGVPRYRDAARDLGRRLADDASRTDDRSVFADREAYVLAAVLDATAALGDSVTNARARAALDTLLKRAYARGRGVRHVAGRGSPVRALLQDQVAVADACLAAAAGGSGDGRYLRIAEDLAAVLERDFADSAAGGYFDVAAADPAAPALADRAQPVLDELLPGPNAWAARVELRLAAATGDERFRRRGVATLERFVEAVAGEGMRASTYLAAAQAVVAAP
ncbi:MAG TPA: DUF255 domain-containing protein [Gemmatimonadales bacterium]|nr:DUF255 domain-containing protein [Gemmatimonadales bacterium]